MKASFNIYWNLNRSCWSVRLRGKVIDHVDKIMVIKNCVFHVSEAGRQRVLREKRKNVHGWIKADNYEIIDDYINKEEHALLFDEIYYSPYKTPFFINRKTGKKIEHEDSIILFHKCVYFNNLKG